MTTPFTRRTTRGPYRVAHFMDKHGLNKEEAVAILNASFIGIGLTMQLSPTFAPGRPQLPIAPD